MSNKYSVIFNYCFVDGRWWHACRLHRDGRLVAQMLSSSKKYATGLLNN